MPRNCQSQAKQPHAVRVQFPEASTAQFPQGYWRAQAPTPPFAGSWNPAAQWVGEIAGADGVDPRTIRSAGLHVPVCHVLDSKVVCRAYVSQLSQRPLFRF